jgi:iron transport multicopper oxidase
MFNGIQYLSPTVPTLLKIINGATVDADFTIPEHTIVLAHNEIVEIHLHGSANGHVHPFQ